MSTIPALTTGGLSLPLSLIPDSAVKATTTKATTTKATAKKPSATTTAKTTTAAKKTTTKATATKTTATKTTAAKTTAAKTTGYATKLPADYAFLRDPKLSIEEKLSRFIGMIMAKSERDLQQQMEKMAPGSTAASGTSGASGSGSTTQPASKKVSIWSLAKTILPPLGMASQLMGDATVKKLVQQLSGPILGAAATALGGPALGALAAQAGPALGELVTRDVKVDLSGLASMVGLGGGSSAASGSTATSGGTASKATTTSSADGATSEKAQLMELQRLQDRDKELFSLFSNMLKSMHDSRMTCIQNLR